MNARLFPLIFLFSFVFLTNAKAEERFEFEGIEMAVPIRIVLYAEDAQTAKKAADAALARFHDLNQRLSDYDEKSEIRRFCDDAGPGEFVRVSDDLWNCVRLAVHHAEISGGAFDPTVGQVVRLWRTARKLHRIPAENRIREALATVGWENILFDEERQAIAISAHGAKRHVRLDLGGIAKGYAIDEGIRLLKERGISAALIDAGGDIRAAGPPPGKDGWTIGGVSLDEGAEAAYYLTLSDTAIATSGDMFQYFEIDRIRYSHIIDPRSGEPLTARSVVSVIAPDAASADALASGISVLGPEKGILLAASTPGVEALVITSPSGDEGAKINAAAVGRFLPIRDEIQEKERAR